MHLTLYHSLFVKHCFSDRTATPSFCKDKHLYELEYKSIIAGVMFPMNNIIENKSGTSRSKNGIAKHIFYADFIIRCDQSKIIWLLCSSQTIPGSAGTQKISCFSNINILQSGNIETRDREKLHSVSLSGYSFTSQQARKTLQKPG